MVPHYIHIPSITARPYRVDILHHHRITFVHCYRLALHHCIMAPSENTAPSHHSNIVQYYIVMLTVIHKYYIAIVHYVFIIIIVIYLWITCRMVMEKMEGYGMEGYGKEQKTRSRALPRTIVRTNNRL